MTKSLHKVIIEILKSASKPLSVREITNIIIRDKLWFRPKDNKLPEINQVSARINNKSKYFERKNGLIYLKSIESTNLILAANITWNPFGWRNNNYINPKAGHEFARKNVGGESLNFNFNKKGIDDRNYVHGYVQWTNSPIRFEQGGLIIFFTRNTDLNKGQIVGVYGKAQIFDTPKTFPVSFQKREYWVNIKAEKDFSMLFPVPLDADNYKTEDSQRIVGQIGFSYKETVFADKILYDELIAMTEAGTNEADYKKLVIIYEYYTGNKFTKKFVSNDEREQQELEIIIKKTKSRSEIINDLNNLKEEDAEEVLVNHKKYKRDNKTIAEIKIIRNFKCQICNHSVRMKDGREYIEAAHIVPKHLKGRETPDNIILLCPNHHKEFDYGDLKILSHSKKEVHFILNSIHYNLKFSIE